MRRRVRKPNVKFRAFSLWHRYFAWYPIRVPTRGRMSGQTLVWLEFVQRRGDLKRAGRSAVAAGWPQRYWKWEYKWEPK